MKTEPITHEQAQQIAQRFIDGHFNNLGTHPRISIPADQSKDDDLWLIAYIRQQQAAERQVQEGPPTALAAPRSRRNSKTAEFPTKPPEGQK